MTNILTVLPCSLAAYPFARMTFPGRDLLFFLLLVTLMLPTEVTRIPLYLLLRQFGMLDSYHALIWPAVPSVFGVFLLRQFFQHIPRELEDAARIDGAARITIWWRVIMPLSTAALVALGIFTFLSTWNELFWPLIVLNRLEMRTLPIGLSVLNGEYSREQSLIMAGAALASVPVLVVYAIFQRRIVQAVTLTGLGGR